MRINWSLWINHSDVSRRSMRNLLDISTSLRNGEKQFVWRCLSGRTDQDFNAIPVMTTFWWHSKLHYQVTLLTLKMSCLPTTPSCFLVNNARRCDGDSGVMDEYGDVVSIVEQAQQVVDRWKTTTCCLAMSGNRNLVTKYHDQGIAWAYWWRTR